MESLNVESMLNTRGNYVVMTLGVCTTGKESAHVNFSAELTEYMYKIENYAQYSMGPNTNNPNSITIPLNNKKTKPIFI